MTEMTTAVIKIAPGLNPEVTKLLDEVMRIKEWSDKRVISNGEDYKAGTNDLSVISRMIKVVEDKRKEYTVPLNLHLDNINGSFKLLSGPLSEAQLTTKKKMLAYYAEIERQRQEAERIEQEKYKLAQQEMELKGEHTVDLTPVERPEEAPRTVRTEFGTTSQRQNWKWEVIDFSRVPDDYKVIDSTMLNSIAKKHHDQKPVPGIRFYDEPTLQVRT